VIHDASPPDAATGAVSPPIYLTSTFAQIAPNRNRGWVYSRSANPTRAQLEAVLARLEGGSTGLAFSSGLGALTTLLDAFPAHATVVAGGELYGGTYRLFEHRRRQGGLRPVYADMTDLAAVRRAVSTSSPAVVFIETPTNPLLHIADLRAIARIGHAAGAVVVVDNTFASPALQRPIEHGADVVLHSTTKYLGGHSDIIGGALVAARPKTGEQLAWLQNALGAVPSPMDCFLVIRGIRTLAIRMQRHNENAMAVARFLHGAPKVSRVYYPGLGDHPQHALARRQMEGYGGMVSFDLKGGARAARRFLGATKLFTLAESLGGVESLAEHPPSMTHASVPARVRDARGIGAGLVRLSCGIEGTDDLVADVRSALRSS
jgi:cystathionine gamma-lyase